MVNDARKCVRKDKKYALSDIKSPYKQRRNAICKGLTIVKLRQNRYFLCIII